MSLSIMTSLLMLGIAIGTFSGMVGVGGGIMIVPALIFFYGLSQRQASATSLAVLTLPIMLLAAIEYHRSGLIQWPYALAMAGGMIMGTPIGARLVTSGWIDDQKLTIIFGFLLALMTCRQLFPPFSPQRATLYTVLAMAGIGLTWLGATLLGRKLARTRPSWADVYHSKLEPGEIPS